MAHIDLPRLMERLTNNEELSQIERIFLIQLLDKLWATDELDHISNTAKTH